MRCVAGSAGGVTIDDLRRHRMGSHDYPSAACGKPRRSQFLRSSAAPSRTVPPLARATSPSDSWNAIIRSRSLSSDAARIRTASSPAFRALPIDTVATGTPAGICTMESSESIPSRYFSGTGTPITGSGVTDASMPGRWAAPPAPAISTFRPRSCADRPYSIISVGIRCADTTSASKGTSNSTHTSAAAFIVGQSESDPITIPTVMPLPLLVDGAGEVRRRVPGAFTGLLEVVAVRRDMADLATGLDRLAVEVDLEPGVAGHAVQQPAVHIDHHRVRRPRGG